MTARGQWQRYLGHGMFKTGDFTLKSGEKSSWKIDCDALSVEDWDALAQMALPFVQPFNAVYDCGGASMQFAAALIPFISKSGAPLVVDDVFTSGATMEAVRINVVPKELDGPMGCKGVVVFARHKPLPWVRAMFQWMGV